MINIMINMWFPADFANSKTHPPENSWIFLQNWDANDPKRGNIDGVPTISFGLQEQTA